MKKLSLGIQTFSKLIEGDYLYIDKTRDIYNFFAEGGQYYFLSRPRGLGKGKEIVLLGIGFDQEKRNIGNYLKAGVKEV